jgi:hypothetical protein
VVYDPLVEVIDEPLTIDPTIVEQLREFRDQGKLANLPGDDVFEERLRLSKVLDDLVERIIHGIEGNPTKLWVLTEFQHSLELVEQEDTEGREHFGMELERLMDILGIESSDGLLACYLGAI